MRTLNFVGIVVSALCVGILTGISVSPIIQSIITSLVTIVVTVFSITAGKPAAEKEDTFPIPISISKNINVLPTTLFILFFTIGCFIGINMRIKNVFGISREELYADFRAAGLSEEQIKDVVVKKYLQQNNDEKNLPIKETVLFGDEIKNKLDFIRLKTGKQLETELRALNVPAIDSFLKITNDSTSMEALKAYLCSEK